MTFRPDAGNSTRPDERQLEQLLGGIEEAVLDLRLGILDRSRSDGKRWSLTAEQLLGRARAHPRETVAADRGAGVRGSGPPDPTMRQAMTVDSAEMVALKELLEGVHTATHALGQAVRALDKATPEQQRPDRPELGCRVCSRPGKPEPIYRAERCQWCYRFWLDWKVDAPDPVLKLRREGKPVTENAIRAAIEEMAPAW